MVNGRNLEWQGHEDAFNLTGAGFWLRSLLADKRGSRRSWRRSLLHASPAALLYAAAAANAAVLHDAATDTAGGLL